LPSPWRARARRDDVIGTARGSPGACRWAAAGGPPHLCASAGRRSRPRGAGALAVRSWATAPSCWRRFASDSYRCSTTAAERGAVQWAITTRPRPQQPLNRNGRLDGPPLGPGEQPIGEQAGISMAPHRHGAVTVQACGPGLVSAQWPTKLQARPADASLRYCKRGSWAPTSLPARKFLAVELAAKTSGALVSGDRGLLIHLFRGIGAPGEPSFFHRDRHSPSERRGGAATPSNRRASVRLRYHQIYATIRWDRGPARKELERLCRRPAPGLAGHTALL